MDIIRGQNFKEVEFQTTNNTKTTVYTIPTTTDSIILLRVYVQAIKSDGSDVFGLVVDYMFHNDSGTLTEITHTTSIVEVGGEAWDFDVEIDGTDLDFNFTGLNSTVNGKISVMSMVVNA